MLTVVIPETEEFDPKTNSFYTRKREVLTLEHSLVSLAKWESKWKKPFLNDKDKTPEETLDYIRCMTVTPNVDPSVYYRLPYIHTFYSHRHGGFLGPYEYGYDDASAYDDFTSV